jgi:uncharacterized repeat protein (TIGR03803 family)
MPLHRQGLPGSGNNVVLAPVRSWGAPQYKILHAFGAGMDGGGLWSAVVFDAHGNLYGTTSGGGVYGGGTVYQLTPHATGAWSETLIHNFSPSGNEGDGPFGGLVFDLQGNLYVRPQAEALMVMVPSSS